jgi:hypothetical protein
LYIRDIQHSIDDERPTEKIEWKRIRPPDLVCL